MKVRNDGMHDGYLAALGVPGDAILKINQASEGFMGARNIRALTGLRSDAETEESPQQ